MKNKNTGNADLPEEEIDDSFPPLTPLTHVRTTEPNPGVQEEARGISWDLQRYERRWGEEGMVTDTMPGNDEWFEVLHSRDGSVGYYHYSELELQRSDDGGGDEGDLPPPDRPAPDVYEVPPLPLGAGIARRPRAPRAPQPAR